MFTTIQPLLPPKPFFTADLSRDITCYVMGSLLYTSLMRLKFMATQKKQVNI